jgi:hypothetical protein
MTIGLGKYNSERENLINELIAKNCAFSKKNGSKGARFGILKTTCYEIG